MGTKEERSMRRRFVVRPTVSTDVNTNETEEKVKPLKEVQERLVEQVTRPSEWQKRFIGMGKKRKSSCADADSETVMNEPEQVEREQTKTAEDAKPDTQSTSPEHKKRHVKQKPFHIGNMRGTQLGDTCYILASDVPMRDVIDSVVSKRTIKLSKKVAEFYNIDEAKQARGIDVYEWEDLKYAASVQYPRVLDMEREQHLKDNPKTLRELLDFYHLAGDTYQRNKAFTGNNASRLLRLIMACIEASRIDDEHKTDLIDHLFDSLDDYANTLDVEDEFDSRWLMQNFNDDKGLGNPVCSEILMLLQYLVELSIRGSYEAYKILCDVNTLKRRTSFDGFTLCSPDCGHGVCSSFFVNGKEYIVSVCTDPADGTPPHIHVTDSEHFDHRDGNDMRVSLLDGGIFPKECYFDNDVILALHNSMNMLKVYEHTSDRRVLSGYQRCIEFMQADRSLKKEIIDALSKRETPKIFPTHQTKDIP